MFKNKIKIQRNNFFSKYTWQRKFKEETFIPVHNIKIPEKIKNDKDTREESDVMWSEKIINTTLKTEARKQ